MKVLKRIVYSPTNANRTPSGTMVVPKFPDIEAYASSVVGDKKSYNELLHNFKNNIKMPAVSSDKAQGEIGYLVEHNNRIYALPTQNIKSFMQAHSVRSTEESVTGIIFTTCKDGVLIQGNHHVMQDDESIEYIYESNKYDRVETRVFVNKSFIVRKKVGTITITPKGIARIPSLKLINEDLLGVMRGEVIDVSWNNKYRY